MELDYQEIGRNIRRYRVEKGWKQKELAERINMSEQHVSHIENAYTQLSLPALVAIANALEVDCNTLLGKTLDGAQRMLLHQELTEILAHIGTDAKKLRVCVEIFRILENYDP